jgi:4'-phosphopantetheinyl transferase
VTWGEAPATPRLAPGQVHVWRAWLDVEARRVPGLSATLSEGERAEAARRRFPDDRQQYIAARAVLRCLLASYLGPRPSELVIAPDRFGKPSLPELDSGVRFNVSHSGGLALYAFSLGQEVGIDVERSVPIDLDELATAGFLSEGEIVELRGLEGRLQQEALLRCWTRKEAYIKAIGQGMHAALRDIQVSIAPAAPAVLRTPQGEKEVRRWTLIDLIPAPGFAASLAVEGGAALSCWAWQWPPLDAGT